MGIGDNGYSNGSNNNGNQSQKQYFDPTYYSRFGVKNAQSNLGLSISYRSGLMIFDISEKKEGFKYETLESIHLSPTKAFLLSKEIEAFKEYLKNDTIIPGKAFGVNAGMKEKVSYIGFHAGEDKKIYITIGKFDENGSITEQATIQLNQQYNFSLEWSNINTMEVNKVYNDDVEIDMIYNTVVQFATHMNGALAYSVLDLARYDYNRMLNKIDPIYDKLGIERRGSGNGYSGGRTNNFLDNASSSNGSNHTSFDSIEGMMEDDD